MSNMKFKPRNSINLASIRFRHTSIQTDKQTDKHADAVRQTNKPIMTRAEDHHIPTFNYSSKFNDNYDNNGFLHL